MILRRALLSAGLLPALAPALRAQPQPPTAAVLPDRGRMLVGFGSGNGTDTVARTLAPQLERRVGRHITVENRVGVSGALAAEALKNGPTDGSLLALLPSTTIAARLGVVDYPIDPLTDMAPVTMLGRFPLAIAVSRQLDVDGFEGYVRYLNGSDPNRLKLGTTASSEAFNQVYGRMMSRAVGVEMKTVGFRGGSAMLTDLEQGRIPAAISNLPTLLPGHRGGRCRILLLTGDTPSRAAPKLPTAADLKLQGLDMREWYAVFTGPKTRPAVVEAWSRQLRALIDEPGPRVELSQLGLDLELTTPAETRAAVAETLTQWKTLLDSLGVAPGRATDVR